MDGQECYFVADAANGMLWHLRYNAGVGVSAYKWELVGGSELETTITTTETFTGDGTYRDVETLGPDVVVPLAGDYAVEFRNIALIPNSGGTSWTAVVLGAGGAPAGATESIFGASSAANTRAVHAWRTKIAGLTAAQLLRVRYATSGSGSSSASMRRLAIRPVRVG